MNLKYKFIVIFVLGLSTVIGLFFFNTFSENYFSQRNTTELAFKELESAQMQLDYQILNNALFLYTNQDDVNHKINDVRQIIHTLQNDPHLTEHYPETLAYLQQYFYHFNQKVESIYNFQTMNTIIKNATSGILITLQYLLEYEGIHNAQELKARHEIIRVSKALLQAKNSMDSDLIASLSTSIEQISYIHFKNQEEDRLFHVIIEHFSAVIETFPRYIHAHNNIHDPKLSLLLEKTEQKFQKKSDQALRFISYFSYLLVALVLISIVSIAMFLLHSERESRRDVLTNIGNRKSYQERIKNSSKKLAIILINIKKFKHYNDFYGTDAGDKLLIETARRIRSMNFSGHNPSYYRLGADDYGILWELNGDENFDLLGKEVLKSFYTQPIIIEGELRTPSIAIAISATAPLLETADMALKNENSSNIVIYHDELNLRAKVAENITKIHELKSALDHERIVPYYQPIVNLSTHEITKHEVLARIILEDGKISSIFPYLSIAHEANLYSDLSRNIITQSFYIIDTYKGDFSINLSIEDIVDKETVECIMNLLIQFDGIGKRIIFEILESEAIEDYDKLMQFIAHVRQYGCRIAIDDFGSGYSNFAHILNLSVDIIKIDGSLIRNLDTDTKAITIVETILDFANKSSIETVAEFVHNEAIATIVQELGIHSAQGFYFYEPMPEPVKSTPID